MRIWIIIATVFWGGTLGAQLEFQLDYLPETERYQFSLYSHADIDVPDNMIGTFQATLVVPTGAEGPSDLQNLIPGVVFTFNSVSRAPAAAPANDYYSVGLTTMAITAIPMTADTAVALFTFKYKSDCSSAVALLDHQTDAYFLDPDKTVNVSNSIVLIYAAADAYDGNRNGGVADCDQAVATTAGAAESFEARIYPNPTADAAYLQLPADTPPGAVVISVLDAGGRTVRRESLTLAAGASPLYLPLSDLPTGAYRVLLQAASGSTVVGTVLKME